MSTFQVGDRVVKNPARWIPNPKFDSWGAGKGVGIVLAVIDDARMPVIDVLWPGGRCFQDESELLPAPEERKDER